MKLLIAGDFCPSGKTEHLIKENEFDLLFNDFLDEIEGNDFNIVNLECPITSSDFKIDKTGPHLKANLNSIEALKFANFNVATLATNHIFDYGVEGLNSTISILNANNIKFVGVGDNFERARLPLILEKDNLKLAIFNIAENEFSNTMGKLPGANPLCFPSNLEDIQIAKQQNDFVIVIYHGGNEHFNYPSPRLKKTLRFFVNAGADAVVAHHTHCFSGYELYRNAPIFYSLGNFIFDYKDQNYSWTWSTGFSVRFNITNKMNFEIVPYSQFYKNSIGISLLKDENLDRFYSELHKYNSIIADDSLLEEEFSNLIKEREQLYLNYLSPYQNKILIALNSRKLLPNFLGKYKKLLLTNIVRCESHRDLLLGVLNKNL